MLSIYRMNSKTISLFLYNHKKGSDLYVRAFFWWQNQLSAFIFQGLSLIRNGVSRRVPANRRPQYRPPQKWLPNIKDTRSRLKKPISPQFTAPIIIKIRQTTSNQFRSIKFHLLFSVFSIYENFVNYSLKNNLGFKSPSKTYIIIRYERRKFILEIFRFFKKTLSYKSV